MARLNLEGKEIKPLTICVIGGGGFIGSHLCEKLMEETLHKVIVIDICSDKINHLLDQSCPWLDRIEFHNINIKIDRFLETFIKASDLIINLASICTPAYYNTRPVETIISNFLDALRVVRYCVEGNKRLIHFSSCEVYGKTIGSLLPEGHPLRQDPKFYEFKEDDSPFIMGSVEKQRWTYASAKQMIERLIYAESAERGLKFTIVRPFNCIGPRMDFIPGIDGPREEVPRVLACFSTNLLRGEPLKLVDGGHSLRTFCYIKDAIEALLLIIENPKRAKGQIFNVGNPQNEVSVKQLADSMVEVYARVSGESVSNPPTVDVRSEEFYGVGYDDSDRRVPDMTIINRQLGWNPKTSLQELLEITLAYQHQTYSKYFKR